MRNQQIKKVNRVFFSGQDEEKRKWIEQMAAEGWQLISTTAFVYSFQKTTTESQEIQPAYRSILGLDLQKSMPIFQEIRPDWPALVPQREPERIQYPLAVVPKTDRNPQPRHGLFGRSFFGWLAFGLILMLAATKVTLISRGDFGLLFRWQFLMSALFALFFITFGITLVLKSMLKLLTTECKSKK